MDVPSVETRESSDGHQKTAQVDTKTKLRWMDTKQKAQVDGQQKVAQELLGAVAETTHAGWSPAWPQSGTEMGRAGMFESLFMEILLQSLHSRVIAPNFEEMNHSFPKYIS